MDFKATCSCNPRHRNQEGFGESVYLGVGGSVKGCGHMDGGSVGEKDLGVGLGGGGGNSGQSGSDLLKR